jgi:hypothetical protein
MPPRSPRRQPEPPMKKKWADPVKSRPAKESTMNIQGDFGQFTDLMKRLICRHEDSK